MDARCQVHNGIAPCECHLPVSRRANVSDHHFIRQAGLAPYRRDDTMTVRSEVLA
jgi:hypothetical protein